MEKTTTEQRLEGSEGEDLDMWKNSKCKHPEVGSCLVFSKNSNGKEAKVDRGK